VEPAVPAHVDERARVGLDAEQPLVSDERVLGQRARVDVHRRHAQDRAVAHEHVRVEPPADPQAGAEE
jgi:hypothetical protein